MSLSFNIHQREGTEDDRLKVAAHHLQRSGNLVNEFQFQSYLGKRPQLSVWKSRCTICNAAQQGMSLSLHVQLYFGYFRVKLERLEDCAAHCAPGLDCQVQAVFSRGSDSLTGCIGQQHASATSAVNVLRSSQSTQVPHHKYDVPARNSTVSAQRTCLHSAW